MSRSGFEPTPARESGIPAILEPCPPGSPERARHVVARLTSRQAPLDGAVFEVAAEACPNPACHCQWVRVECRPIAPTPDATDSTLPALATEAGASADAVARPVRLEVEVLDREMSPGGEGAEAPDPRAECLFDQLQDADWELLQKWFWACKQQAMEQLDLDTVEVLFPEDLAWDPGRMVAYAELFPWSKILEFEHAGRRCIVEDQYCCHPGCDCTEAALSFYPAPRNAAEENAPLHPELTLRYDFQNRRPVRMEVRKNRPAPDQLLAALRTALPDLDDLLKERHRQLQYLARRILGARTAPVPAPIRREAPKTGRNDPCPCGSGRKFKQCCLGRTPAIPPPSPPTGPAPTPSA